MSDSKTNPLPISGFIKTFARKYLQIQANKNVDCKQNILTIEQ